MSHYSLEPANFPDYRLFLKHRFDRLKAEEPAKFSLLGCARRSKVSKSHLQFLFTLKRHLTLDKFPPLARALRLTDDEEYFVFLMICKDVSQNDYVKTHFERILSRLRHERVITDAPAPKLSAVSYETMVNDHVAEILHSLVKLEGFREDPEWILKSLPVPGLTKERVVSTLEFLERSGAVTRDAQGRLESKDFPFWRPDPLDPRGQMVFRKGAEAVAQLLVTPEAYKPSVYMMMALAMDEARLKEAEKLMIELHHKLMALAQASEKPTANLFTGNFLLTLARLKAAGGAAPA